MVRDGLAYRTQTHSSFKIAVMSSTTTHPFGLEGQTLLVVGASSGIGAETARMANRLGADLILASRSEDKLQAVRTSLDAPDRAAVVAVDYLDSEAVQHALSPFETVTT